MKIINKENTKQDWVGKVIYWKCFQKLKCDHTSKSYMHNLETAKKNEIHKLYWDFEIQTYHLILARLPDILIVNIKKRTCWIVEFTVPADHRVKLKEREKRVKYLDLARELKKLWNMLVIEIPIVIRALGTFLKGLEKELEDLEIREQEETTQTTALSSSATISRTFIKI